ncbi:MAG: hypothetical protein ACKO2G_07895 [Verrucomicrobiales bacterium]
MKRNKLIPLALAAFTLAVIPSCGKKEPAATPPPGNETAAAPVSTAPATTPGTPAPAPAPEAPKPSVSAAEIAPLIGHGAGLSKDFETLVMFDLGQVKKKLEGTELWKKAKEEMGIGEGDLPAPAAAAPAAPTTPDGEPSPADGPAVAPDDSPVGVGTEAGEYFDMFTSGKLTVATGPGTGTQTTQLLKLMNLVNATTYRTALVQMAQEQGLIEDTSDAYVNPMTDVLKKNFDVILESVEKMDPPMLYIAVEAKGKADKVQEMLASWNSEMSEGIPPFVVKEEKEMGGGKFVSFTVKAAEMISIDDMREGMSEDLEPAQIEKLHAALIKKQVSFGFGLRGESLVLFLAPNPEALKFTDKPDESMAARPEFSMLGEAKGKNPFLVLMAAEEVNKSFRASADYSWLSDMATGVLGEIKSMGDLRDVIALVEKAGKTLTELARGTDTAFCGAGWFENGVRFEGLGGADSPDLDASVPLAFANALDSEDTMLAIHTRADKNYTSKVVDLLEDLAEIGYELGHRYAESEPGKEAGMAEQFTLFRDKMLPHVTALWKAARGKIGGAVDSESAFVMDMGAPIPKFPGLPEALTKGRVPRMALLRPVVNRALITEGWKEMEPAIKGMLAALPMPEDSRINLPDPSISEKESLGLKTFSYPVSGFTNDDFLPSASISEKYFFLSTSKNFSEMLAGKLAAAKPDANAPRGLVLKMRFDPLTKTALEWLDLAKNNASTVFPDDSSREEFLSEENTIREVIDTVSTMDSMTLRRFPEGSQWRTSIHFKTK